MRIHDDKGSVKPWFIYGCSALFGVVVGVLYSILTGARFL